MQMHAKKKKKCIQTNSQKVKHVLLGRVNNSDERKRKHSADVFIPHDPEVKSTLVKAFQL